MTGSSRRVVVLGAGYAGVRAARDLARQAARGAALEVVLVTDSRYHLETPLLYEVATAYLHHESTLSSEVVQKSVCIDLEDIFAGLPVSIRLHTVEAVNVEERALHASDGAIISYDTLVVALGAKVATYGISGVNEFAFSVKSLHESLELRHHIVRHFHMAKQLPPSDLKAALTFVVAGAGAAGIETAAELAGQVQKLCQKTQVSPTLARILVIEAGPVILKMAPPRLQTQAAKRLQDLGIQIRTGQPITAVTAEGVTLASGEKIPSHTVIWTGGLAAHAVLRASGLPLQGWGVACEHTLQVAGHPNIFAAGDSAVLVEYPEKIPAIVPVAYTQGSLVARNIMHQLRGEALERYRYESLGALIATGGKTCVAVFSKGRGWSGFLPWLVKKMVTLRYWCWYLPPRQAWRFWWHSMVVHSWND